MSAIKTLTAGQLNELRLRAAQNPRLRANLNLHEGDAAALQRFAICLLRGSYVRPHRHMAAHKLEMASVLDGEIDWVFFDESGAVTQRVPVSVAGEIRAVEVPPGIWHGVLARSTSAVFLEVKLGPYDAATDKQFAPFAPEEGSAQSVAYLSWLKQADIGTRYPA